MSIPLRLGTTSIFISVFFIISYTFLIFNPFSFKKSVDLFFFGFLKSRIFPGFLGISHILFLTFPRSTDFSSENKLFFQKFMLFFLHTIARNTSIFAALRSTDFFISLLYTLQKITFFLMNTYYLFAGIFQCLKSINYYTVFIYMAVFFASFNHCIHSDKNV